MPAAFAASTMWDNRCLVTVMSLNRVLLRKYACGIGRFHLVGQPVYHGFVTVALLFELTDAFVELG
jgi:hypothetical protein